MHAASSWASRLLGNVRRCPDLVPTRGFGETAEVVRTTLEFNYASRVVVAAVASPFQRDNCQRRTP
jgi:hypothetical protein